MSRLFTLILFCLLMNFQTVLNADEDAPTSLIKNGSFEKNIEGWRQPSADWSWGKQTFGPVYGKGVTDGSLVFDGQGRKLVGRAYQYFTMKDWPSSLLLSGSIKANKLSSGWYAYARLVCMDAKYHWLAHTQITLTHKQADGQWRDLKAELDVPEGTTQAWLFVRCDAFDKIPNEENNTLVAFDNLSVIPQHPSLEHANPQMQRQSEFDRKLLRDNLLYAPGQWRTTMNDVSVAPSVKAQTLMIPWKGSLCGMLIQGVEIPTGMAMKLSYQARVVGEPVQSRAFLCAKIYDDQKHVFVKEFHVDRKLTAQWQTYEGQFEVPAGQLKDADVRFSVKPSGASQTSGHIEIRDFQLLAMPTDQQRTQMPAGVIVRCLGQQQASVYLLGQQPVFEVTLANNTKKKQIFKLKASVCDDAGNAIQTVTMRPLLDAMSKQTIILDGLPKAQAVGYYPLHLVLADQQGHELNRMVRSYMVIAQPDERPNDPFFGFSVYRTSANLAPVYAKIGIGAVMELIDWPTLEPVQGQYWFGANDRQIKQYRDAGLKVYGFFGAELMNHSFLVPRWNRKTFAQWNKSDDPTLLASHLQALEQFADATIARYADQVDMWHVKNEIDGTMHSRINEQSARYYIGYVKAISKAARRFDPTAKVSALGITSRDVNHDYRCLRLLWAELKNEVDQAWPHPYASPRNFGPGRHVQATDEYIRASFAGASQIGAAYGKPDIGCSEIGYMMAADQPVDSSYQRDMAKVSARMTILCRSIPQLKYLGYFTAIETSPATESYANGYSYGLWSKEEAGFSNPDKALYPRPTAMTYAAAVNLLSHVTDQTCVDAVKNLYLCAFRKDQGYVLAAWTTRTSPVKWQVKLPHALQLRSMFGTPAGHLSAGEQAIELSDEPVYMTCAQGNYDAILKALRKSHSDLPKLAVATRITGPDQVQLVVANQTPQQIQATVTGPNQSLRTFQLEASDKVALDFQNVRNNDIFVFETNAQRLVHKVEIQPLGIPRAQDPLAMTGRLESVRSHTPIYTFDESSLYPPDAKSWGQWNGPADFSGKLWLQWDANNLYIACEVIDDVHEQDKQGKGIWAYDTMILAIDAGNNAMPMEVAGKVGYDADDYELCIGLNPTIGSVGTCYHAHVATLTGEKKLPPLKVTRDAHFTRYEVAIPWSYLSPLKPVSGTIFKANVVITDADAPSQASKYWMGITHGIHTGKNPEVYKTFVLE